MTHAGQFAFPLLAQVGIRQQRFHNLAAVSRRAGIAAADQGFQRTLDVVRTLLAGATDRKPTQPLAIQRDVFRKRIGDQKFQVGFQCLTQRETILVQTIAKALIGNIEQRQQAAALHHLKRGTPLRRAEIGTGRVMTARMQQHHAAFRQAVQRIDHRVKAQAAAGLIEIRIGMYLQSGALEDRPMVGPGRI
ncbi:hypothetical protein D3C78_1175830 [compost metagenome]